MNALQTGYPAERVHPAILMYDDTPDEELDAYGYEAMGGPPSQTRVEHLSATLLGTRVGHIRCRRVVRVGFDFGRRSPFACVNRWLKACGFADEVEARAALALPADPCICRPDHTQRPPHVSTLTPRAALKAALILGLSTPWLYDPSRPIVWTTASLTRRLELFDGRGFYA